MNECKCTVICTYKQQYAGSLFLYYSNKVQCKHTWQKDESLKVWGFYVTDIWQCVKTVIFHQSLLKKKKEREREMYI